MRCKGEKTDMAKNLNIVIVGVGGQGTLLASRILGHIAQDLGADVKVSEVHGMSQRGGSVITYVRMGDKVFSPMIEQRGADYILAFEELEALRVTPYLKDGGEIIVNSQRILPLPVIIGAAKYPDEIETTISMGSACTYIDALPMAEKAGNSRAVNTVLIGALAKRLPDIDKSLWLGALHACVPAKFLSANLAAFESGYGA